jgi:hypothetical protein
MFFGCYRATVQLVAAVSLLLLSNTGCAGWYHRLGIGASIPTQPKEAGAGLAVDFDSKPSDTKPAIGWRVGYRSVSLSNDDLSSFEAGAVFEWPLFLVEGRAMKVDIGVARHSTSAATAWAPVLGLSFHTLVKPGKALPVISMRYSFSPIGDGGAFPFSDVGGFCIGLSFWCYFE